MQVDHHEAGKRAATNRGFGLRFARITPGGRLMGRLQALARRALAAVGLVTASAARA